MSALRKVPEAFALLCPDFNSGVQQLVSAGVHPRPDFQGCDHASEKGKSVGRHLDDYKPITVLNTELKIWAKILTKRLQSVVGSLLEPEQTCAVRGRTSQSNLDLIRTIIEGVKDDERAAQINLDQTKAFDKVDHQYLAVVLRAAGFEPDF